MKLKTIIFVVIICIIVGLIIHFMFVLTENGVSAAFSSDLAHYVRENQLTLPSDWSQFVAWSNKKYAKPRWKSEQLNSMFEMEWGKRLDSNSDCNHLLTVKSKAVKRLEEDMNMILYYQLAGLCNSNPPPPPTLTNANAVL